MHAPDPSPAPQRGDLHALFARPAGIVATVCQMLLGLALGVALILKAYMLVFTDHTCTADATTLGNAIRCTGVLGLMAGFLAYVAAVRLAALLFAPGLARIFEVLLLALIAVLLGIAADLTLAATGWAVTLTLLALGLCIAAAALAARYPADRPEK